MIPSWLKPRGPAAIELCIKVVPGASRDRVVGPLGDALKVQVSAPPERGKANASVARLIANVLGVAEKQVRVVRGSTSPRKALHVDGINLATCAQRLRRIGIV